MPTLKDVAKKSGVSVTTVSRVLRNDQSMSVSEAKRKLILDVAKQIGYQSKHQNYLNHLHIGVVLWYDQTQSLNDPYYMEIRDGILASAKALGIYILTLYKTNGSYDYEQLQNIDGLILLGKFTQKEIKAFSRKTKFMVFVDSTPDTQVFDSVIIDFKAAMKSVTQYCESKNYRRIGYIGGYENNHTLKGVLEPREKYLKAYLKAQNRYDEKHFLRSPFTSKNGYEQMKALLEKQKPLELYLCANDSIAIGAMKALHEAGYEIPQTVGIIGFNDIAQARYMHPSLTTVKIPIKAMGEEAIASLLAKRDHPDKPPVLKILPTKLIKRHSA